MKLREHIREQPTVHKIYDLTISSPRNTNDRSKFSISSFYFNPVFQGEQSSTTQVKRKELRVPNWRVQFCQLKRTNGHAVNENADQKTKDAR